MRESKLFFFKSFRTGKFSPLRKIDLVCREKEFYDYTGVGIWWNRSIGVGIMNKPNKGFKYLMIGFDLFTLKVWINFTWIGKMESQPLTMSEDSGGEIKI